MLEHAKGRQLMRQRLTFVASLSAFALALAAAPNSKTADPYPHRSAGSEDAGPHYLQKGAQFQVILGR